MLDATIKQLRSLEALGKYGTVAAAARHLHVSPPAVGQQIRLLERAAGIELVTRTPAGLKLTPAGETVVATARHIETELHSCDERLEDIRSGRAGTVALGAVSTAKYFAPHVLAPFGRAFPGIEVSLHIGNRRETIRAIEEFDVDLVIMGRPPDGIDLVTHEIAPHPHVVVAHREHRLVGRAAIGPELLEGETFLLREPGSGTRTLVERMLSEFSRPPAIGMEIASNETIKQAVMAGLGLALLSWHTVAHEVSEGRLAVLDIAGMPIVRSWYVLRHEHAIPTPAAEALWDFIVEHAAEFLPPYPD